jgi:hypothetical protein
MRMVGPITVVTRAVGPIITVVTRAVGPIIAVVTRAVGPIIAGIVMRVVVVDTNAMRPNRNANLSF